MSRSAEIDSLLPIKPDDPNKSENFLRDFGMEWGFTETDDEDGGQTDVAQQHRLIEQGIKRLEALSESRAIKRQIKTYQQILMWLEDQEDSDALALLAKDISVELDKLFKELKERR